MGLTDSIRVGASAAVDSFQVQRSLRFNDNDSHYLERTPSSDSNRTTMTLSVWVKRANFGEMMIMESYRDDANRTRLMFDALNRMQMFQRFQNNSHPLITEAVRKDTSEWYHLVWSIDTTQSTSSNRVKMYVNNVQQSFISGSNSQPDQNEALFFNKDERHTIGVGQDSGGLEVFFDGYMAEMNFIDGQQLTPSSFAETNADGKWVPKDTSDLTFGTNGFRLEFSDNSGTSATTLGKDTSGNSNNYTPNSFATTDPVKDTPTNNFCNMSPLAVSGDGNHPTFTDGNLKAMGPGSGIGKNGATFGLSSGKWYVEAKITHTGSNLMLGIINVATDYSNNEYLGSGSDFAIAADALNKKIRKEGSDNQTSLGGMQNGDILAFAVDMDNGTFQLYNNGSTKGSAVSFTVADYAPITFAQTTGASSSGVHWNYGADSSFAGAETAQGNTDGNGQGDFYYSPPSGFLAVCEANLPTPSIAKGNLYFDALLWSGTGSTQNITGLEFQPDWVWAKKRSGSEAHDLQDAVRGATKRLSSNNTNAEITAVGSIDSFDSNGFTVDDAGTTNESGFTYVGWCWNGGGSTVTNNDGNISSQVRASATSGFSIVSYQGNGTSGSDVTIGHGLGVAPKVVIIKKRTSGGSEAQWGVLHHKLSAISSGDIITKNIFLQTTGGEDTYSNYIKSMQSTTFTLRLSDASAGRYNKSGEDYIAYCFSEVTGFSKHSSYIGNGQDDGQYVFMGFRPAWVLIKNISSGSTDWIIKTDKIQTINTMTNAIKANEANAEASSLSSVDFLANGMKIRNAGSFTNQDNQTYIYLAFAVSPFKFSRAR